MKKVTIRSGAWTNDREQDIFFPEDWEITEISPPEEEPMSEEEIRAVLFGPAAVELLKSRLGPGKRVLIMAEDITRPALLEEVLGVLGEVLSGMGITDDAVTLFISTGTHTGNSRALLERKFGRRVLEKWKVIIHDCRRSLAWTGTSRSGIDIFLNRAVAEAENIISVGTVSPHDDAGFSGGEKIMVGAMGLRTISLVHRRAGLSERGKYPERGIRIEAACAAAMTGLFFSINGIVNSQRRITSLFAGGVQEAFSGAAEKVKAYRNTGPLGETDVIISSAYPYDTSPAVMGKGLWPFRCASAGALKVLVASPEKGFPARRFFSSSRREDMMQFVKRYSMMRALKTACVRSCRYVREKCVPEYRRNGLTVYSPGPGRGTGSVPGAVCVFRKWPELLEMLKRERAGFDRTRVTVVHCAPLLYCGADDGKESRP